MNTVTEESHDLISADKVEGTAVYNRAGDKLGTVEDVMLGKRNGKVAYAIMSFGGFLGMGEKYHPLPWSVLDYNTECDGYVVDLDKETLKNAPHYGPGEAERMSDREYQKGIYSYYQVPPAW